MNERIRTLATLATTEHTSYFDGRGNVTQTIFDKEKFAELIVQECMDLALGSSHREDDMGAIIANKIKKHFGVEE